MPSLRRITTQGLVSVLALASCAAPLAAQEANFVILSAYAEDADGGSSLQPNRTINIVIIANNQGEGAARNARVRVELRSATVAFMNEPSLRTTDVVLGDFGARVSQQVFVPVVATDRTSSIDIVVTPLWDGQRGAAVPQTHRFPTGFPGVSAPAPTVSTGVPASATPPASALGEETRRRAAVRPTAGTRLTRAQLSAQPMDAARALRPSQVVSGTLDRNRLLFNNGTPVELWYYEGTAGETVTITLESPSLDTYLMLNRLGGRDIATDDDGAGNLNSRISQRLPETGTYVVIANALGARAAGTYTLSLASDRPASVSTSASPGVSTPTSAPKTAPSTGISTSGSLASAGRPLTVPEVLRYPLDANRVVRMGATVNGRLTASDPKLSDNTAFHAYYFNGFEGDRVSVTMRSSAFDAYLHFGQLGGSAAIATDDDSGGGTNSRVTVTLPATGTYVILANVLSGGSVGAYTLEVRSP